MPVGRHPRDKLTAGTVLAQRLDRSRLVAVTELVLAWGPRQCVARVTAPDGSVTPIATPHGYLPRHSEWLRESEHLDAAQPLLPQLRALVAARRQAAERLANGPTMTRFEAAAAAGMRDRGIDKHRLRGAFRWVKRGREILIDRASFEAWLVKQPWMRESGAADGAQAQ